MRVKSLKPKPNNPKIDAYYQAVIEGRNTIMFIVQDKGGWLARKPGSTRTRLFIEKNDAINYAKSLHREIVIFDKKTQSIERYY